MTSEGREINPGRDGRGREREQMGKKDGSKGKEERREGEGKDERRKEEKEKDRGKGGRRREERDGEAEEGRRRMMLLRVMGNYANLFKSWRNDE